MNTFLYGVFVSPHHDADGLAAQKTWRITQTTMRRFLFLVWRHVCTAMLYTK
jgi:hypothetical protein